MSNQEQRTKNQERSDEVLVRVDNVSKKFCKSLKRSLWYGMCDTARELNPFAASGSSFVVPGSLLEIQEPRTQNQEHSAAGNKEQRTKNKELPPLRADEFWAVKNVSFELKRGECLGLIGHNGAGKSTLLKMLNGLIKPDTGRIEMHGRIGALIELGAGFNPILTGRENIYNKGAILGFTKKEINQKFDEIVDFAEIEEFIDMPVQNYSSGMRVRLGFSVSAQMEPDVLIIDEVLAVGDMGFMYKSLDRLKVLLENSAVIFVSHAMNHMAKICSEIILLDHGVCEFQGHDVAEGITRYQKKFSMGDKQGVGTGSVLLDKSSIKYKNEEYGSGEAPDVDYGDSLIMEFELKTVENLSRLSISLAFWNQQMRQVAQVMGPEDGERSYRIATREGGRHLLILELEKLTFNAGQYSVSFIVTDDVADRFCLRVEHALIFNMKHYLTGYGDTLIHGKWHQIQNHE